MVSRVCVILIITSNRNQSGEDQTATWKNSDTVTLFPLHILFVMLRYNGAFYILHLWCFSCSRCQAWPHNCDDREKTALMYDPGLSRQVSTTAHSTDNDMLSPTTHTDKRRKYKCVSPVSTVSLCQCCPFHCQYQQKCQQWASVSTLCQIITGSGDLLIMRT